MNRHMRDEIIARVVEGITYACLATTIVIICFFLAHAIVRVFG